MFMLRHFFLLAGAAAVFLFIGCSNPIYRQGNLTQGTFEANVPENFSGIGKELARNSSIKGFSLSLDYTTSKEMKMRNVENAKLKESDYDPLISESDGDYTIMSETKIKDFRYKRNRFPVSFAFTHLFKANENDFTWGYSIGLDPGLYARIAGGINKKHFEVGAYFDIEFVNFGDVNFDYYECTSHTKENGCLNTSEEKHFKEKNVRQSRLGGGFYVSFYMHGFAVSYAPFIYVPASLQAYDLEETNEHETTIYDGFHTRVDQPFILSQYIGISKWINEHWKLSLGSSLLSNMYLDDVYLTVNSSLGYWF
jgi:hypothetical protein